MTTLNLVIGDPWNDGHGKSRVYTVTFHGDKDQFEAAYQRGAKLIGVDITKLCDQYEDDLIPAESVTKLESFGYKFEYTNFGVDGYHPTCEEFFKIYMFTTVAGGLDPEWKLVPDDNASVEIGGYGLFL